LLCQRRRLHDRLRPISPAYCVCLLPAVWRLEGSAKQHGHSDNGLLRPRRCHRAVTTRCVLGELTGDSLRQFPLVRLVRESL
jgi:hypothetical protein